MTWKILVFIILVLSPFIVYSFSKLQMMGWLTAIKQLEKEEENEEKN